MQFQGSQAYIVLTQDSGCGKSQLNNSPTKRLKNKSNTEKFANLTQIATIKRKFIQGFGVFLAPILGNCMQEMKWIKNTIC